MVSETGMSPIHKLQIFIELLPPIMANWRVENHVQNNGESCDGNICLSHLQRLKMESNVFTLNDWKEHTFFKNGRKNGYFFKFKKWF